MGVIIWRTRLDTAAETGVEHMHWSMSSYTVPHYQHPDSHNIHAQEHPWEHPE